MIVLVFLLVVGWFLWRFSYWKRKGVGFVTPGIPFGNVRDVVLSRKCLGVVMKEIYEELKKGGGKFGGFWVFTRPVFMPVDPEIVKAILTKDFRSFQDRGVYHNEELDPLSAHLFAIEGVKWKKLRTKLSPTFSSGKMKMMFQTLVDCSQELRVLLDDASSKETAVDIKDIAARFTTDVISTCAFGLDCTSLKNPDSEFRSHGKKFFELTVRDGIKRNLLFIAPEILRPFKITVTKEETSKFFLDAIKQTVAFREANQVDRNDMMSLLLKLKNNESIDDKTLGDDQTGITFNQLAAQCFVFFLAGFETSSTTMTFLLFELAQNQDIQDKLRQEIRQVLAKYSGQLSYEAIMEMRYMDKVISETLRKYPPLPFLNRTANEDWRVPGTNVVLEKGTKVMISNYGLHMDPEYFPEPEVFDPERFSESKSRRHSYCYLPFGEGPRNCIGIRFGLMQTKVGLSVFLKDHSFRLHPSTILPITFDVSSFILSHKYKIWLQITPIDLQTI